VRSFICVWAKSINDGSFFDPSTGPFLAALCSG
jgi:hypothetical protein